MKTLHSREVKRKRLSVIVPMYNTEKWIERCVESIIGQSFLDFEVIIIDDGSIDNSLSIVREYCKKDQRIRCISTKNQGSAKAKNIGLKYVSGDIVTFVDADDFVESDMYKTMISVMDTCNADIVECACRKINKLGRQLYKVDLTNEEIEGKEQCLLHFVKQKNVGNYMWNKIYKKELFEGNYFPDLKFSEDYYMNVILHSKSNKKVIIPHVFYNYMIYPGQTTDNRYIDIKRLDGIRAGNMIARRFCYDKRIRYYAGLYACKYALSLTNIIYQFDRTIVKKFLKMMRLELFNALLNISFREIKNEYEKKVICQSFLLLIMNIHFFDLRWLLE